MKGGLKNPAAAWPFPVRENQVAAQQVVTPPTVAERVRAAIAKTIGYPVSDVTDEKTLSPDLNMDSLDRFQLSIELEDAFGITITDAESAPLNTVGKIVALVQSKVTS